jgi:hypothetical protein
MKKKKKKEEDGNSGPLSRSPSIAIQTDEPSINESQ